MVLINDAGRIVFYDSILEGGTEQAVVFCIKSAKPYKLIDIDVVNSDVAAARIISFIGEYNLNVLNVAEPRHSICPAIYSYVRNTIQLVLYGC